MIESSDAAAVKPSTLSKPPTTEQQSGGFANFPCLWVRKLVTIKY